MDPKRPSLPDLDGSIRGYVRDKWEGILADWRRGYAKDTQVDAIQHYLEVRRQEIFERKEIPSDLDWELDWVIAKDNHNINVDFVRNRKAHNDDLKKMWAEWEGRLESHFMSLALEALRTIVLVNGAAIIAAITVLSGQIAKPIPIVVTVAKITVFSSVVSIIMMAIGHCIVVLRGSEITGRVRGVLVGNANHNRLYAINRYIQRYMVPYGRWADALVYGSIAVFAGSAFICALLLMTV